MSSIAVIYWSMTGNTQAMAEAIAKGAREAGAQVDVFSVDQVGVDQVLEYDQLALGCPAMGAEVLEEGEELSLCRHLETGRTLYILNRYLRMGPDGLWCEDSTDYRLPVAPGDKLTLVARTKTVFLCKKDGVTGWYYGRLSGII